MTNFSPTVGGNPIQPNLSAPRFLNFILDHNPCFILSALSMIFGCYLFSSALDLRAGETDKLLSLIATINLYEFALIGIAALIFHKRHVARDGLLLLIIQALFLADATFLISETVAAKFVHGWMINVALLLLAFTKTWIVLRLTRITITARTFGFMALQLSILYLLPIWLRHSPDSEHLRAHILYIAWWAVGLLPLLYDLLSRFILADDTRGPHAGFVRRLHLVTPWLLTVAHLAFFHYVYDADFYAANLAPIMLGLAVVTRHVTPSKMTPKSQLAFLRYALPILGILLVFFSADTHHQPLQPRIALTLAATLIVYTYLFDIRFAPLAVAVVGMLSFLYLFGPSLDDIQAFIRRISATIGNFLYDLLPKTGFAVGILAIVAAFALLGIGSLFSLKRRAS